MKELNVVMKSLDWQTLRDEGYLQEVNRTFFHPLGLALAIRLDNDGKAEILILDCRDDPEGFRFTDGDDLKEKASRIRDIFVARRPSRVGALGYWEQPIEPNMRFLK